MKNVQVQHWIGFLGQTTTVILQVQDDGLGVIDKAALTAFRCGQCHALALAIHELTGWPIKGLGDPYNEDTPDSPAHCVVWNPALRRYIDIGGIVDRRKNRRYRVVNRNVSKRQLNHFRYYLKPDVEAARPFARAVLRQLGIE